MLVLSGEVSIPKSEYNAHPMTCLFRHGGEAGYSFNPFATSALDRGMWSAPCPDHFTPGRDPKSILQEAEWALGTAWTSREIFSSTGIGFPNRPTRSMSLYRIRHPGRHSEKYVS